MAPRVLIVDDDILFLKSLARILKLRSCDTATAEDGFKAIEKVREKRFDYILMDIVMQGMNGVETYKEIKGISPQAKVIMMTAYSVEDLVREALDEGAYGVVYKPPDIDKILGLLKG